MSIASRQYGLTDTVALECLRRTPFRLSLTRAEQEFELDIARRMKELGYISREVQPENLYLFGLFAEDGGR